MGEASRVDARVALLEGVYVQLAIHMGRELVAPQPHPIPQEPVVSGRRETAGVDWEQLGQFQVDDIFLTRVPMLESCPHFLRGRLGEAFQVALRERFRAKLMGDEDGQVRGWKLFALVPMMLLHRPFGTGSVGGCELVHRADWFAAGRWAELIREATQRQAVHTPRCERSEEQHRGKAAQERVQRGQVSRARHELTGAKLAPKDEATLNELRNRRPQEQLREIPGDVLNFQPEAPVQLDRVLFATSLRGAPSGSSPQPGGCSCEMLRVLLDDREGLLLLTAAAEDFARGDVPHCIFSAFTLATITALQKRRGGVSGIATGTSFRRLVAKTLARQLMGEVEQSCAPFQFALSTRAGTDCVGHAIRAVTERQPDMTVLSLDVQVDGRAGPPEVVAIRAQDVCPTVSLFLGRSTRGETLDLAAHPLMPLLFSLAIHDSLAEICKRGNSCSRFWTTCTSFQSQTAPGFSTICWPTDCTQ